MSAYEFFGILVDGLMKGCAAAGMFILLSHLSLKIWPLDKTGKKS